MLKFLLMLENISSQDQAIAVFRQFGATDFDLATPDHIKYARNRLLKQHHSDKGGYDSNAAMINNAYAVIKNGITNLTLRDPVHPAAPRGSKLDRYV